MSRQEGVDDFRFAFGEVSSTAPRRSFPAMAALAMRLAAREMRGGLSGFVVFVTCIALGVAAIGGVNSVAQAISTGVQSQGQELLGGDIRFRLLHREAGEAERAHIEGLGEVSVSAGLRSMVRLVDGSDQTLVEVKSVDEAYPLYGEVETAPPRPLDELFKPEGEVFGAVVPQLLFDRLGLEPGERVRLGDATFELRAELIMEPDAISDGFGLAPRLLTSLEGLRAAGLVREGSLVEHLYKVRLPAGTSDGAIAGIRERALEAFPEAGWSIRGRANAAPALSANIERFSQFLTLVGLTALVVGGVGVANAVRAYIDGKRGVIATFKSLGASGRLVFATYLFQILAIAALAILIGLVAAAAMPPLAGALLSGVLPVPPGAGFHPGALAMAAIFGLLVTLAFTIPSLGRARDIPAASLFREMGLDGQGSPRAVHLALALAIAALLAVFAVWFSSERRVAVIFVGATICAFLMLRSVSWFVQWAARRCPRVRSTALRLAIGNIHRPGALTPSVVLSLGLGLTLLVTLALIEGNLRQQVAGNLPDQAPNFFFVDIQTQEAEAFSGLMASQWPGGELEMVPMLRGRIMALDGVDVREIEVPAGSAWVLRGDRGLTYADEIPANSTLVEGQWWEAGHEGEPLVSFSAQEAREIGLSIGDTVTVNVLGRNITATIVNLRELQWESLGINFVMVFSPNTFAGAPHAWLATFSDPGATASEEASILREVTAAFPTVTSVRVQDALDIVNRIIAQLATAIRAAAAVALLASVLVLSGALAAGNRARIHDAVVLKTLGATRRTLIGAFSLEYLLIGLATAFFALLAGGVAGWFVVSQIMGLPSSFLPEVAASTLAVALILTVGLGLIGTWRVLGHKAAPVLRNL